MMQAYLKRSAAPELPFGSQSGRRAGADRSDRCYAAAPIVGRQCMSSFVDSNRRSGLVAVIGSTTLSLSRPSAAAATECSCASVPTARTSPAALIWRSLNIRWLTTGCPIRMSATKERPRGAAT